VAVSARFEAELVGLAAEERAEFLSDLGLTAADVGLPRLVRAAYEALDLITFFTAGKSSR
jgi:ribosome-binding ATPase YchF (GTP1/OBG family)